MIRILSCGRALLIGLSLGFVAGQRYIGVDCGLSPTAGDDIARATNAVIAMLTSMRNSLNSPPLGGFRMPIDPMTLLLWLVLATVALAAVLWWLRNHNRSSQQAAEPSIEEPTSSPQPEQRRGRDYKLAIGSAGVKSIVREARMEEAYQVRSASETAFEAFADFDNQQERVRADYAAYYNLGLIWAQRSDATQRQDGLARLATACRINEHYQLGSAEACNELQTLVGPRTRWPTPVTDPLINARGLAH